MEFVKRKGQKEDEHESEYCVAIMWNIGHSFERIIRFEVIYIYTYHLTLWAQVRKITLP